MLLNQFCEEKLLRPAGDVCSHLYLNRSENKIHVKFNVRFISRTFRLRILNELKFNFSTNPLLQTEAISDNLPLVVIRCNRERLLESFALLGCDFDCSRDLNQNCSSCGRIQNWLSIDCCKMMFSGGHCSDKLCYCFAPIEAISVVNEKSLVHEEFVQTRLLLVDVFVVEFCKFVGDTSSFIDFVFQFLKQRMVKV